MSKKPSQQELAPRLGRAAEHLAAAVLLRNNNVWVSIMPDAASVDMIVVPRDRPDKRFAVQIKAVFDAGGTHRTVNVARSNNVRYKADEVDFVLAVDAEAVMFWLIPVKALRGAGRIRLGKKYSGYAFGWHDSCPVFGGWAK